MGLLYLTMPQNLPKIIYPKVNTYAKNPMKTDAEANNVF